MKTSEVIGLFVGAEMDAGYEATLGDPVEANGLKGHEYRLTKGETTRRLVLLLAKPRMVLLSVTSDDAAKVDSDEADGFLKSFALVPPGAAPPATPGKAKQPKAKPAEPPPA